MYRAIQLARRGLNSTHPNPRVGCVMVRDGRIIGEGWHAYAGGPHAEVNAISNAIEDVHGADCYVTLEPCSHTGKTPPCTDALIAARIARLVAAMQDPNPAVDGTGLEQLKQAGIRVETGLLENHARELNPGYIKRRREQRPFIRCKLAMSLDARTALASGESRWISGEAARLDVQRLRAQSSAIMTGIGTVLADDPQLSVRDLDAGGRQPLRVIIDPQLKIPVSARILNQDGRTLVFTRSANEDICSDLRKSGAEIVSLNEDGFLDKAVRYLAMEEEINEILLECGSNLAGGMLKMDLIDEIIIYLAPLLMGDDARGLFHLPDILTMGNTVKLELIETRQVGKDIRLKLKVKS